MKKIIFIFMFISSNLMAQKYWKGSTTSWTGTGNWVNFAGTVVATPTTGDDIIILAVGASVPGGGTVIKDPEIAGTANCRSVTFNNGSILQVTSGALNVYGTAFTNNSGSATVLTANGGIARINFRGNSSCTVGGNNIDFGIIEVNKTSSGSVTLNSSYNYTISNFLYMNSNTLNTNDKLTFLSNFTAGSPDIWATAYIDPNGSGTINGDVIMQQKLHDNDDFKTYHLLCSPVYTIGTSGDPDHWSTTMLEDNTVANPDNHGTGSWAHPSTPVPDWIFYDETVLGYGATEEEKSMYGYLDINPLWTGGSATGTKLEFGQGCFGRFEAIDNILDWKGIPNKGTIVSPVLSYTNHSQLYDGANLLGNPYPSPIDLGSVYANNNPAEISKFFYVWRNNGTEYGGTYDVFDAEIYDGDGDVAIGRGFLVLTLDDNVTLTFSDGDRLTEPDAVFRRESIPQFSYKINLMAESGNSDLTSIYYGNFESEFIKNEDALKIFSPDNKGNAIYSKVNDKKVAMNHLPATLTRDIVPLEVKLDNQGQITLTSKKFNVSKSDFKLIFEDRKYGRYVNFDADFEYKTICEEGLTEGRFFIHTIAAGYEENLSINTTLINSYYADGKIIVQSQTKSNEIAFIQISEMSGRVLYCNSNHLQGLTSIDATQFSKGIYNVTLTFTNGNVESQKVMINY